MKGFWNDQNGFNLADLEKLTLVITFILSVLANLYNFVVNKYTDILMVQMCLGIGGLLVVRKGLSYFKKDSYMSNIASNITSDDDSDEESVSTNTSSSTTTSTSTST